MKKAPPRCWNYVPSEAPKTEVTNRQEKELCIQNVVYHLSTCFMIIVRTANFDDYEYDYSEGVLNEQIGAAKAYCTNC